jgi:putative component of membrane protein insertase Oxa1/YidC/SpoIIIJ protein YidD
MYQSEKNKLPLFLTGMILFISVFFFLTESLSADNPDPEITAWEYEDLQASGDHILRSRGYVSPLKSFELNLIRFYQKKISVKSISRCPYYISCSHFAYQAIEKYGPYLGVCLFIDRTFYRENPGAYFYYPLKENQEGNLKLDDSFYLHND